MNRVLLLLLTLALASASSACTPEAPSNDAQKEAKEKAANAVVYSPKNDIELKNYNKRQVIADDPTTILWCTVFPTQPGAPIFTFPIVGKLTSGNKRPYAVEILKKGSINEAWYPEIPGPDGMSGSSGEYRYGFTPADVYVDFYNLETLCTTEPMVVQREETTFALEADPVMAAAHQQAREALGRGDKAAAQQILQDAVDGLGTGDQP